MAAMIGHMAAGLLLIAVAGALRLVALVRR